MVDTIIQTDAAVRVSAEHEDISFEEFLKKYDGQHAEWVLGKVEVQVSNNIVHQKILGFLYALLNTFLSFKPVGQIVLAGYSMKIGDDKPAREPDLMIVLNEHAHQLQITYLDGPADIAVEVVSPESAERDYGAKFVEYEAAKVREYWRFDPQRQLADIYVLTEMLDEGVKAFRYHRTQIDESGRLVSSVLPGFSLDSTILWRDPLPDARAIFEMVEQWVSEKS